MKYTDLPVVTDTFGIPYREYFGLFFHANTTKEVADVIIDAYKHQHRLSIVYGDTNTGKTWGIMKPTLSYRRTP